MKKLEHGHSPQEIAERFSELPTPSYLRDWIYGGIDGAVTTFAVVSGVVGGHLSATVILILGFANLLADGFSMAAGNYLGTKSEIEQAERYKAIELRHIELTPNGERDEVRQIFKNKGLKGEQLENVVNAITEDKTLWINTMLQEEYGLPITTRSPKTAAFYTFLAFTVFGLIPLLPYVFNFATPFFFSCTFTVILFFIIGSIKSFWSIHTWYYSGIETLIVGSIAASLSYVIGLALHLYLTK